MKFCPISIVSGTRVYSLETLLPLLVNYHHHAVKVVLFTGSRTSLVEVVGSIYLLVSTPSHV